MYVYIFFFFPLLFFLIYLFFAALPVTVFGTEKFGCRPFVMYGGCALFVGYFLSSIAPNIEIVMLAQGVIAGKMWLYFMFYNPNLRWRRLGHNLTPQIVVLRATTS
jgi:hypothetical protein